jgi:hypothetical protein
MTIDPEVKENLPEKLSPNTQNNLFTNTVPTQK